jgi:hypothetical protein
MRLVLTSMAAAWSLTDPAAGAETRNFDLETTADLVALCSCPPDDPLYAQALQFCYGYLAGLAHLHRALVGDGKIERLACPSHEVAPRGVGGPVPRLGSRQPGRRGRAGGRERQARGHRRLAMQPLSDRIEATRLVR